MQVACLLLAAAGLLAGGMWGLGLLGPPRPGRGEALPATLSASGLYADPATHAVAPGHLAFSPQYPLWTDGATKRRWIRLPAGHSIDARDPDRWRFPAGTRLFKEFSFGGRRVETRVMQLGGDGAWSYAAYHWDEDEQDASRVPSEGARSVCLSEGGRPHDIPSVNDCRACHETGPTPVLGFSALQLSPVRDPLAPHAETPPAGAVDIRSLVERGLLVGIDASFAPVIDAPTPRARAALGYLHGNCASCHRQGSDLQGLDLSLEVLVGGSQRARAMALETAVGVPPRLRLAHEQDLWRVAPGSPRASLLVRRAGSRNPLLQMPPLGSRVVDAEALSLLEAWIAEDIQLPAPCSEPHTATLPKEP